MNMYWHFKSFLNTGVDLVDTEYSIACTGLFYPSMLSEAVNKGIISSDNCLLDIQFQALYWKNHPLVVNCTMDKIVQNE